MKDSSRNYVAVGAFVIAMLAALIAWFAVLSRWTSSADAYYIEWDNVMGLKEGTQILFEGYQIGLIDSIRKGDQAGQGGKNYRIDIEVEKGWPIPDSAIAETTAPTFLAALVVNIDAGESTTLLQPGSEIESSEAGDLLGAAGDAMAGVSDMLEFLKPRVEEIMEAVNSVLSEQNAAEIAEMLDTLNARLAQILSEGNADRIDNILMNLDTVSVDVSDLTKGLRGTKEEIDNVLGSVTRLMDENRGDIGHALKDLHASLETVSRHIDSITSNLDSTMRNANEFSGQIRENPGVLLRGRDVRDDAGGR
jgi:phospholipid/cholesterol/gamma-HCH transport system substrate-binding protein